MRRIGIISATLAALTGVVYLALILLSQAPVGLHFSYSDYENLPGWAEGDFSGAFPALSRSCEALAVRPDDSRLPGAAIGGTAADWHSACSALSSAITSSELRTAIEDNFTALEVTLAGNPVGLFTGYFETLLHGSRTADARYSVPLYARPGDLIMVDLGAFRPDLKGRRIAGRVEGGRLIPYADRQAIDDGVLDNRNLELVWVDSAVDAFFLHIQGSGRVKMQDGSMLRVGYAAQNGHPYLAIGRVLVARGELARDKVSMQTIRAWLDKHPDQMNEIMQQNASFIFFRELGDGDGPYGSANVPLTAGHSLAVDRNHLPLHAPVWLSTSYPDPASADNPPLPFNRLMVAQDTGGAINGEIRGDVFWGFGEEAEEIAGRMANYGRYWLLLPNELARSVVEAQSDD